MLKKILLSILILISYNILAQNQPVTVTVNPNPVEAGNEIIVSVTYYASSSAGEDVDVSIELKNTDGNILSTIVEATREAYFIGLAVVGDVTNQITLTIPSNTIASSTLPSGQYYDIKVIVNPGSYTYDEASLNITINEQSNLNTIQFKKLPAQVFPNPVEDFINIIATDYYRVFNSYKIFDIRGRSIVKETKLEDNKINVSQFSKGLYLLQIDNYKLVKFIKQ